MDERTPEISLADRGVSTSVTRRAIQRDLHLLRSAIELVASGGASRVSVGGLAFGGALLPPVAEMAARRHVRIGVPWSPLEEATIVEVWRDG